MKTKTESLKRTRLPKNNDTLERIIQLEPSLQNINAINTIQNNSIKILEDRLYILEARDEDLTAAHEKIKKLEAEFGLKHLIFRDIANLKDRIVALENARPERCEEIPPVLGLTERERNLIVCALRDFSCRNLLEPVSRFTSLIEKIGRN